jgi:hypothetical protein
MRPGRLAVLLGTLVATGALYLKHLAVGDAAFRAVTGASVPTIWQELGGWGRPAAALLAAGLVAVSFRPGAGLLDRTGAVVALLLAAAAAAGGALAREAAGDDAAVVTAALGAAGAEGSHASAGPGFLILLVGTGVVAIGAFWDAAAAWQGGRPSIPESPPSVGEEDKAAF